VREKKLNITDEIEDLKKKEGGQSFNFRRWRSWDSQCENTNNSQEPRRMFNNKKNGIRWFFKKYFHF